MRKIRELIVEEAKKFDGEIGIGYKDLKTGAEYYYKGKQKFYMASTFKIPVLIAFYDLVMKGEILESDKYLVKKEEIVHGSGVIKALTPEQEYSLEDLATLMMILSDNTATDIICKIVTFEHVKEIMDKMGLENTIITKDCLHIISDFFYLKDTDTEEEAINKMKNLEFTTLVTDKDNVTMPIDIVKALDLLYNNKILNEKYCKKVIEIMFKCMTNSRIPRCLPIEVKSAHKTGTIHGVVNDAGIVYTPTGDYIIVFYSNSELENEIPMSIYAEDFISQLSRKIYDEYIK